MRAYARRTSRPGKFSKKRKSKKYCTVEPPPPPPTPPTPPPPGHTIQKQLTAARKEEQNAMAEFRRYETPYYEELWAKATEKVQRLEAKLSK
jgi:hypothetical protein